MTKSEMRKDLSQKKRRLDANYMKNAGERIQRTLKKSDVFKNSGNIFIYLDVDGEPGTRSVISEALKEKKAVYVPLCLDDGVMKAVRIYGFDELKAGRYGIQEPICDRETAEPDDIDLAVIPCVCASLSGKRLGHGKGYYDRFLENFRGIKICLCYSECIEEDIPTDEHDVVMNAVITENTPEILL